MSPPPLPFQLQDPSRLRTELLEAGLRDVRIDSITEPTTFHSGRELWNWILGSNPIVETVLGGLGVTEDEKGVVRDTLDEMFRKRSGRGGSITLTSPVHIGVGTKRRGRT